MDVVCFEFAIIIIELASLGDGWLFRNPLCWRKPFYLLFGEYKFDWSKIVIGDVRLWLLKSSLFCQSFVERMLSSWALLNGCWRFFRWCRIVPTNTNFEKDDLKFTSNWSDRWGYVVMVASSCICLIRSSTNARTPLRAINSINVISISL